MGNGINPSIDNQKSNIWLNPNMSRFAHPLQKLQYHFYLNAACVEKAEEADKQFMQKVHLMLNQLPFNLSFMLLAFDYHHNEKGQKIQSNSTFYVPNEYAARMANSHAQLEWVASVHPYREDALEALEWCAQNGAKSVKWLPPAMNIDPSSKLCDKFYDKLVELNLPLLSHAGEEKAVHSDDHQKLGNPLTLRRPLEAGVKVIVAHCGSLGESEDIESSSGKKVSNFLLFSRLMNEPQYKKNLLADISAINLFNREISVIETLLQNQHWHSRLLYASDYPIPGVMPLISTKNLASNGLVDESAVDYLNQIKSHNIWLFDFLLKRQMSYKGNQFLPDVFQTRKHFL